MKKPEITADKLGIVPEARRIREVIVLPRGRLTSATVTCLPSATSFSTFSRTSSGVEGAARA